jgi:hypothetical protein
VSEPGSTAPTVRLPAAVLAVAATLVVALLAVALVVRFDTDRLPSGPPRDPPAAPPAATGLTVSGQQVMSGELKVTLPGPPFVCRGDVPSPSPAFPQLALCTATVHRNFDGQGSDWAAVTGVALVDDSVVAPDDLPKTTASVFDALMALNYSADDHPTLSKVSQGAADVAAPPGRAYTRQANVTVKRPGLATPYDRLVVFVVRLESGRHVVFFSDFPHDGSKAALDAVVASATSLSAQR